MHLPQRESYEALIRDFRWEIPGRFNIGRAVADDWAAREPDRLALEHYRPDGNHDRLTYGALRDRSNALAHGLRSLGVGPGDRVALLLPQSFATVIAHVAIYKIGAIALPLARFERVPTAIPEGFRRPAGWAIVAAAVLAFIPPFTVMQWFLDLQLALVGTVLLAASVVLDRARRPAWSKA